MADPAREALLHNPFDVMAQSFTGMNADLSAREVELQQTKASMAIEKYLGLKPEECKMTFRFTNHVVDEPTYSDIKEKGVDLVVGELNYSDAFDYGQLNYHEDVGYDSRKMASTNPGIGQNPGELQTMADYMKKLVKEGVSFATTDSGDDFLYQEKLSEPYLTSFNTVLGSRAVLVATLAMLMMPDGKPGEVGIVNKLIHPEGQKITRREFMKMMGMLTAIGLLAKTGFDHFDYEELGNPDVNVRAGAGMYDPVNDTSVNIEDIFGDPIFMGINNELGRVRNGVMALNTWHVLGAVDRSLDSAPKKVMFFAGSGHADAYDEFLRGPEELEKDIKAWADRLCEQTLNYVKAEENGLSDLDGRKLFNYFATMFSNPAILGSCVLRVDGDGIPKSAYDVLIESIDRRLNQLRGTTDPDEIKKLDLLQLSRQELVMFNKDVVRDLGKTTETINNAIVAETANK